MNHGIILSLAAGTISLLTGCANLSTSRNDAAQDQVTQLGQINALMLGHFDGIYPISELLSHGDFGLGTLDHLDGELIILDGQAWQGRVDGSVRKVSGKETTPFAMVTPFQADGAVPFSNVSSLKEFEAQLDSKVAAKNNFVALRLEAQFSAITFRAVPAQQPPYKPLVEVVKSQLISTRTNVAGTLVGFRSPQWVGNLTVPGYHWHFLSDDKSLGGHVFDLQFISATVAYDLCGDWLIKPNESILGAADLTKDTSGDLNAVEKQRGH